MGVTEPETPYVCGHCGQTYPVPSLARDCEARHDGPMTAEQAWPLIRKRIY